MGNPGKRAPAAREPDPDYLKDLSPPEWLSDQAREVWLAEAPKFRKARLLAEVDVMAFAMMCESFSRYRRSAERIGDEDVKAKMVIDEESGKPVSAGEHMNPWAMLNSMYFKQTAMMLGKFGATPQDRTRVELNPQGDLFSANGKPKDAADPYFH